MKTIIDCNIIISAGMDSAKCMLAITKAIVQYDHVVSREILAEYAEVISRAKFIKHFAQMSAIITQIASVSELVDIQNIKLPFTIPDQKDEIYLRTAIASGADFLITGNLKDFPERQYGKTKVISVVEFLLL